MKDLLYPAAGVAVVLAGLVLSLLIFRSLGVKLQWPAEIQRKAVHIAMGISTMFFPWIFASPGPVWILCGLAVLLLGGIQVWPAARERLGGALHGVNRSSLGEIYFAVAVAILFQLAHREPVFYVIPLLILTLADAAGALIGTAYGKHRYQTLDGRKSTEGSVLFFLVAYFCVQTPLTFWSDLGKAESLLVSLTLASLAMLLEGIATRGLDNLVLPLLSWYILQRLARCPEHDLLIRIGVFAGLAIVVIGLRRRATLDGSSLLGAILFGYTCVFVGSWPYLLPPLILYLSHIMALARANPMPRPFHNLYSMLAIAGTGLVFIGLAEWRDDTRWEMLIPFSAGIAAHFCVLSYRTQRILHPDRRPSLASVIALLSSSLGLLALPLFFSAALVLKLWACHLVIAAVILAIFQKTVPNGPAMATSRWRWALQFLLGTLAGVLAWLVARAMLPMPA